MKDTACRITVLLMAVCLAATSALAMPSYNDVLLVVNAQSPESQDIGAYFKAARNIPDANVCTISVKAGSDSTRMGNTEKWAALDTIKDYMVKNGLTDKINYIVLTRGIPTYAYTGIKGVYQWANPDPVDGYHLFDVFLMYQLSDATASVNNIFNNNPYYYYNNDTNKLTKKFSKTKFGYYIVGRLDGLGTVTIKDFIDSTGAPAYESYKKQANGKMKLLTLTPAYSKTFQDEIDSRGNIEVVSPTPVTPATKITTSFESLAKDVMFAFLDNVGGYYYGVSDFVSDYPFIYRGATFLPGSLLTCYRSFPAMVNSHGSSGGVVKMNVVTKVKNSYVKLDASDMKFRNMTCAAYDPVNNQLWCGTGKNQLDVTISFDSKCIDEIHRETMRNYGGGIVIYDAAGNVVKWINANDPGSSLKNNRVVKLVYDNRDSNAPCMWVAHFKGVQYYDCKNNVWNDVPAPVQNDYAAAVGICLDPFDSDKVYFSFYYNGSKASSLVAGADTSIFEYNKKTKDVISYVIDSANNKGIASQMGEVSVRNLWVSKGNFLYRYDLTTQKVVEKIDMSTVIPEMVTPPANLNNPVTIDIIRNVVAIPSAKVVLATVGCNIVYKTDLIVGTPSTCQKKNYVVRITESSNPTVTPSTVEVINTSVMNVIGDALADFKVRDLAVDPADGRTVYMPLSTPGTVVRSTDDGKTWSLFSSDSSVFNLVNGIALDGKGNIYATRGYAVGQNIVADFQAFGLAAFGGGMSHDVMTYGALSGYVPAPTGGPYYSVTSSMGSGYSQTEPMIFMLLDGFYMGEARLAVFKNYTETGGGGHQGHMTVFEPKSAPFAPRVNEALMPSNPQVATKATIEIPILSPGLPWQMNDVIRSTLNANTIQITDETGAVFTPDKIEFFPPTGPDPDDKDGKKFITGTGKLVISGNYTGILYKVKLICGISGIKNIKGASLTNTRPNEFKDDITLTFGNGVDIGNGVYVPPAEVTGPVKMPQNNSKVDLVVSSIALDPSVPVAGKPLTVNFQIKNIGTVKTSAGTITAGVYWNNILIGSKTHGDLAAGASTAVLSVPLDAQYVTVGNKNTVMAVADSTNIVTEMRETNNTTSTKFFIDNRPDLIVKTITLSSTKPGKTTVNFNIANTGFGPTTAGAGAQVAAVYVNNIHKGTVNYNDLAKGAVVSLQLPDITVTAGTCKVKVVADSTGIVTEVSKTNNSLEKPFNIR